MPISIIDNFTVNTTKNIDSRLGPYSSIEEATSSISPLLRYVGMTLIITGSGNPVEYWFSPTINNNDLILKSPLTSSNAISASYAQTASFVQNAVSASYAQTASFVQNAVSASYVLNTISSSYSATTSLAPNYVLNSVTASMLQPYVLTSQTSSMTVATASYVVNAQSASYVLNAVSASYALTASFAPAYVLNSLTSSFVNSSQTSSMIVGTASLALRGSGSFIGNFTGSLLGTASWALNAQTASFLPVGTYDITSSWSQNSNQALTASYVLNAISSSYSLTSQTANTASYILNAISASYAATAALAPNYILISTTSSMLQPYVLTSQTSSMTVATASYVLNAVSSSFTINAQTASLPLQGIITASASNTTITFTKGDGSVFNVTVSQSGSVASASYALFAQNSATASYITSSNVYGPYGSNSILSASYASTSSYAFSASDVLLYVKNQSGQNIAKGVVVRITGSNNASDIPRIVTASYENDNNSANTLGITQNIITNGNEGYVVTEGILTGINTTGLISGQLIYLGPTGSIIGYAPTAPLHAVRLGEVIREQSNNGSIYVRIDNGYEIDELHNILITSASNGDLLTYSSSLWINSKQLTGSYVLTGSLIADSFTGSLQGTSSWAQTSSQAISSSFASTSSFAPNYLLISATSSMLQPYVLTSQTSSMSVATASFVQNAQTASYVLNAVSASFASTSSFAPNYLLISTTSSMLQPYVLTSQTSSMSVATASFVQNAQTASYVLNAVSASFVQNAQTASFLPIGTYNITSSWAQSSSQAVSASWAANGGVIQIIAGTNITISPSGGSGSVTINSTGGGGSSTQIATGSVTASVSPSQFIVASGSITEFIVTGNGVVIGNVVNDNHRVTGSLNVLGSINSTNGFSGSFSGSFFGNGAGLTGITATADTTAIEAQVWFLT